MLRPGRLDVKIRVGRPTKDNAKEIFARHLDQSVPTADSVDKLIEAACEYMYADRPYVELTLVTGEVETLHYRDFISGAMIANIGIRERGSREGTLAMNTDSGRPSVVYRKFPPCGSPMGMGRSCADVVGVHF